MIKLQREDFDVGAELSALSRGQHNFGAIAAFVGVVREAGRIFGVCATSDSQLCSCSRHAVTAGIRLRPH